MAALLLFGVFLIGINQIISPGSKQNVAMGWLSSLQNNWLIVLFDINFEINKAQINCLNVLDIQDIVIMALFGVMSIGLFVVLRRTSKFWALVAVCLPFLGIVVFLITQTAGRSGLLVAGLIFSILMMKNDVFRKVSAYVGIAASALLFFGGDLGTTFLPPSKQIAILIGIGYVLWILWFVLVGRRLFQIRLNSR